VNGAGAEANSYLLRNRATVGNFTTGMDQPSRPRARINSLALLDRHALRDAHADSAGGAIREVERHALGKWSSIVDADGNSAACLRIAYAEAGAERQRPMSGSETVRIEPFA
jgi:hypothetical protein